MDDLGEIKLVGSVEVAGKLTLAMRSYLSTNHLWAARHFAALSRREETVAGDVPRFSIRNRAYRLPAELQREWSVIEITPCQDDPTHPLAPQ